MSMLTSQTASRQYAQRPADERFPSLEALVAASIEEKNRSGEKTYNLKDLRAVAVQQGPIADRDPLTSTNTLQLESPKGRANLTHWAFGQLARTVGAPAQYLRELPPQLAAQCINHGLQQTGAGSSANILARMPNGDPTPLIRACTSDQYGRVWDADLYGAIQQQITAHDPQWTLPPTWSGEPAGAYRGDRDSFLILVNGGSIVTDPSLRNTVASQGTDGSNMYRGILVRNSEVGAASITIETVLYRFICGNHMLWGAMLDKSFKRRHVGAHVTRDTIREISRIAFNWSHQSAQRDDQIIAGLISHEIAQTKAGVIDELRALGASEDQAERAYARCEQTEAVSPRSFWGAAQGLTRISQESEYQDLRYQLDKAAANVLRRGAQLVKV